MSAETLRRAAALMRERAEAATDAGHGWRLADLPGANEVWANRDAVGHDAFMVATTATRLNPNPGVTGHADAAHIASWHPAVALAVADWLDTEAVSADYRERQQRETHAMLREGLEPYPAYYDRHTEAAIRAARAYLGVQP